MATAPTAAETADRPYFLETHYYNAGLRTKPLGSGGARPAWAPSADWIGFHDEVTLQSGDVAVEFAKFMAEGQRVSWLGLYRKSVDHVYGDRQNHEGIGVWLREASIVDAQMLLDSLLKLLDLVHPEQIGQLDVQASRFMTDEYLPRYVITTTGLPEELTGWRYSQSPMSETEALTIVAGDAGQAWREVADKLIRVSWLGDGDAHTRVLILVPGSGRQDAASTIQSPSQGRLLSDLVRALPEAFSAMSALHANQKRSLDEVSFEAGDLRQKLAQAVSERDRKAESLAILEQEIAQNDTLKSLVAIKEAILRIDRSTGDLRDDLRRLERSSKADLAQPLAPGSSPAGSHAFNALRSAGDAWSKTGHGDRRLGWKSAYTFLVIVIFVVGLVMSALLFFGSGVAL